MYTHTHTYSGGSPSSSSPIHSLSSHRSHKRQWRETPFLCKSITSTGRLSLAWLPRGRYARSYSPPLQPAMALGTANN